MCGKRKCIYELESSKNLLNNPSSFVGGGGKPAVWVGLGGLVDVDEALLCCLARHWHCDARGKLPELGHLIGSS